MGETWENVAEVRGKFLPHNKPRGNLWGNGTIIEPGFKKSRIWAALN